MLRGETYASINPILIGLMSVMIALIDLSLIIRSATIFIVLLVILKIIHFNCGGRKFLWRWKNGGGHIDAAFCPVDTIR